MDCDRSGALVSPNPAVLTWPHALIAQSPTVTTFGALAGAYKWFGGVLAPDGCIYGIPYNSTSVLKIDPVAGTATTFGSLSGNDKWFGGVLAADGCIYGIPFNSTSVLKIDPVAGTATTFGDLSGAYYKWVGGVLAPDGCIYGIPFNSTSVLKLSGVGPPVSLAYALAPERNKL